MSALKEFLQTLWNGKVLFSSRADWRIGYDRCQWGQWNYYAFYCFFFKVMVSK